MSYVLPVWNCLVTQKSLRTRANRRRLSGKWGKILRNCRDEPHNSLYDCRLPIAKGREGDRQQQHSFTLLFFCILLSWRIWIDHYVKLWFVAFKLQNLLHILARRKSQLARMTAPPRPPIEAPSHWQLRQFQATTNHFFLSCFFLRIFSGLYDSSFVVWCVIKIDFSQNDKRELLRCAECEQEQEREQEEEEVVEVGQ